MSFVHKKGIKTVPDFPAIYSEFFNHVHTVTDKNVVPPEMLANFNQTNAKYLPASEYRLKECDSKQVSIIGMENKREMTFLLAGMSDTPICTGAIYAP